MDYLSLCLICKDENNYLPEWLDYHILMGVDRFYIYDNESEVSLRDTLKDYIERGWVEVVDIPGYKVQLFAYDHCLQTFGINTFWLGFIDTDEFLVPKTTLDLKSLLKDYEAYGGLVVSSLFFGANNNITRPVIGQIAAYTGRTHATFVENELVKSIVQPKLVQMPVSPHDFSYQANAWGVNENFLRVDGQRFPNYVDKIQLNHYFCRSKAEIELKLSRGGGARNSPWPRKRFEVVNSMSTCEDTRIITNLEFLFQLSSHDILRNVPRSAGILEKMAILARARHTTHLETTHVSVARDFRPVFNAWMERKLQCTQAREKGDYLQVQKLLMDLIQMQPQFVNFYLDLAINYLSINNPNSAWDSLTQAWKLAPNSYNVLRGMGFYFLRSKNFVMAEKTIRLLLDKAPNSLEALGFLTEALIGQSRFEDALKVGIPVVELSVLVGELDDGMGVYLVKLMADYLIHKKEYIAALHLWELGIKFKSDDVNIQIELINVLLLTGKKKAARQHLDQAQALAPQNEAVQALIKQLGEPLPGKQNRR